MATAGEFGRVKRSGDYMKGALDHRSQEIVWTDGAGLHHARIRHNGPDLEFYDITSGGWKKLSDLVAGGLVSFVREIFTAVPGQTAFVLTVGSYVPGNDSMQVYVGGLRMPGPLAAVPEYVETNATTVTLTVPCAGGEIVELSVPKGLAVAGNVVLASPADTTPSNLDAKTAVGSFLKKAILNPGGNEQIETSRNIGVAGEIPTWDGAGAPANVANTLNANFVLRSIVGNPPGWGTVGGAMYAPGAPADWAGAAPTTIQQALDRIAAALATHLGVPIA